ncbi:MAG: hypothetical protein IT479_03965 [Xanthomonadales bacterium]|nr:hypothetical protein [Xanthomonadales bacterium]
MVIEPYSWLVTVHVVLFAYWLGGDFGVYVCSRYIVRADLPVAERERFLEALMAIDILPRTAIVLLPAVGLQLATMRGSVDIGTAGLIGLWALDAAWLAVVWMAYRTLRRPSGIRWQRIDVGWRILLIAGLVWAGVQSLRLGTPIHSHWIAAKLLVYSALLIVGLYLRVSIRDWREGFIRLRRGEHGAAVDTLFVDAHRRARHAAWLFWTLIITMAWLGITQPF